MAKVILYFRIAMSISELITVLPDKRHKTAITLGNEKSDSFVINY
jgi:hypothetical protein